MSKSAVLSFVVVLWAGLSAWAQIPAVPASQAAAKRMGYYEQYLNDKVENTQVFASIHDAKLEPAYRPEGHAAFPLAAHLVPLKDVVIVNTRDGVPDPRLTVKTPQGEMIAFFVHPVSENAFKPHLPAGAPVIPYAATPLASYRSLLVWGAEGISDRDPIMNIKVSLDAEIGATSRMLSRSQIERAAVASLALKQADLAAYARQGVHFIDEPFSVYLKNFEYGYTWREMPALPAGNELVPLFSLYAQANREEPMVRQMARESGLPLREFVREKLMRPLIDHMFEMAFEDGIISEPHEQNVTAEIRKGKLTGRFFYRDLGGFHISPALREAAGKNLDFVPASFDPRSLRTDRADLLANLRSYLVDSSFFALRKAVDSSSVTKAWVEETALKIVAGQIEKRTGARVQTWSAARGAITKYTRGGGACRKVFAP